MRKATQFILSSFFIKINLYICDEFNSYCFETKSAKIDKGILTLGYVFLCLFITKM